MTSNTAVTVTCLALLLACCRGYTLESSQIFCISPSALVVSTVANETTKDDENLLELVPAEEGDRIELLCQLCSIYENETKPVLEVSPRLWYRREVQEGGAWQEVQLGMDSPLTSNRVYTTPQHTLVIQNFQTNTDSGRYECCGLDGDDPEDPIVYLLDGLQPLNASEPYVTGNLSLWSEFESRLEPLGAALDELAGSETPDVAMHWAAWGPCEDCEMGQGQHWRRGRCRVVAPPALELLPFNLTAISCRSELMDHLNISESVHAEFLGVPDFVLYETCECRHAEYTETVAWQELQHKLEEGDNLNLVCPGTTAHELVEWKRGFDVLASNTWMKFGKKARMRVDSMGTLRIEHAEIDVAGRYSCRAARKTWNFLVEVDQRFVLSSAEFRQHVLYLVGVLGLCLIFYIVYITMLCLEPPEVRHKMALGRSAPPSPLSPYHEFHERSPLLEEVISDEGPDVTLPSEDEETWVPLTPVQSPARRSFLTLEEGMNPKLDERERVRRYLLP